MPLPTKIVLFWLAMQLSCACSPVAMSQTVDFVRDVQPIFARHCVCCHGSEKQESGLRLDIKSVALKGGDHLGPDIVPQHPEQSPLMRLVQSKDSAERMPPDRSLADDQIATLQRWIEQGAQWPDGVDKAALENRLDHWSFAPLPELDRFNSIDQLIDAELARSGLKRSSPARPGEWLRRVSYDLVGLPPTPEQMDAFTSKLANLEPLSQFHDGRTSELYARDVEAVYSAEVERLLASPRYGERWAQHWLDVVRYADTHGFEVNTERPNAWPYRDYVIRAFNNDTPYDRFIQEQITGDAWREDAATGFLITASVLLPGQIGKDEPSIRLARQDALDEIVNNISQTFLGLSIGCARCHDHKFDPVTAQDYYSMQAMVAGVEYEDRELQTAESDQRKQLAKQMKAEVAELDKRLMQFAPLARPNSSIRETNATGNEEVFDAIDARFVRFTIIDANLHPGLGLIEPCIDEFEIYAENAPRENVALATNGTIVTASGSRESDTHKLKHIHDGQVGNASSWMSDSNGRGWVQFELPQVTRVNRIFWSRDRTGKLSDRLPTAYRIQAGITADQLKELSVVPPKRPAVNRRATVDRFPPVSAQRLRFTITATNSLDPCLDELEVFNTRGENVALAARGTKVRTSGHQLVPQRHDPSYVNDGAYGNQHSWLGNEPGKGWVELDFGSQQMIERVVWSRDREGPYEDRLPIGYRIESCRSVQSENTSRENTGDKNSSNGSIENDWQVLADSSDRVRWVAGMDLGPAFSLVGLDEQDAQQAAGLLRAKRELESKIRNLDAGQLVFAGKFRRPDEIRLLLRGDPEQPRDLVPPAVPKALGQLSLPLDASDSERRRALAEWIASPSNPLTARVMANRIWQGHFGMGFVETSSDFGRSGTRPTHARLLDLLARRFIESGWSIKAMHRWIVLSETYRQTSSPSPDHYRLGMDKDADVRLLWRYPSRRLDAEVIRDSMLSISGELDHSMYGRGFDLFDKRGGLSGFNPVESFPASGLRRMIYAHKVRREREAVFGVFDCPDAGQSTARRRESTTPLQALNLLNSRFTLERASALADRLRREAGDQSAWQVRHAMRLALGREPSSDESVEYTHMIALNGLEPFCRALLNCNEGVFLP